MRSSMKPIRQAVVFAFQEIRVGVAGRNATVTKLEMA